MKVPKVLLAVAVSALVAITAATPTAIANPRPAANPIVGGERAPQTDWAVQLYTNGQRWCSASQVNERWVLTARHCLRNQISVHHSNDAENPGPGINVTYQTAAPNGDVALLYMGRSKALGYYPPVDLNYQPRSSGTGRIMGYGARGGRVPSDGLYQADVKLIGEIGDEYDGQAQWVEGINGSANFGDSGGPLIVDQRLVAVLCCGPDPGYSTNNRDAYSTVSQNAQWYRENAGS